MIEIKQVRDSDLARKICEDNGVTFRNDYHVIATIENGITVNHAIFTYKKGEGEILSISGFNQDLDLLDGLCRSILNVMDLNGVETVSLPGKYRLLAEKTGFKPAEYGYVLSLKGFFDCGRCCKGE